MNPVDVERVTYVYPQATRPALDQVDLRVEGGERLLIAGASGSGKSTLLRTVNGLVPHFYGGRFAGRAAVMGHDTRHTPPQALAAHVGMVFQDLPARFLSDSVEAEIAFSLELGGNGGRLTAGQVQAISERMGVAHLAGRRLEHLSAGEQARLAIAAALARRPSVLLLDEPLTHIDPAGSQAVVDWVTQLSRRDGVAVLLAEHRIEVWRERIDRTVVLGVDGKIRSRQSPPEPGGDKGSDLRPVVAGIPPRVAPATTPSTLRARAAAVTLGGRAILRGVDFELTPGELVALVGRNGSGKTTLLRSLVGLQRLEAGEVELDGKPVLSWPPAERFGRIGFVPQAPASMLFADTAEEEIALTQRRRGGQDQVEAWMEAFGLGEVRLRYPRDLSAGERQRLALAAVLAGRPSVLLLDEPTLGMDGERLEWLGQVLTDLRRAGCAILVATHDPGFVAAYATRAMLLQDGCLVADGSPATVLQTDPAFAGALVRWEAEAGPMTESQGGPHADG